MDIETSREDTTITGPIQTSELLDDDQASRHRLIVEVHFGQYYFKIAEPSYKMAGNIDTKNFLVGDLRDIEDVDDPPDAKTVLRRWLSTRSVLTTASIHEDEAALNLDAFRAIGKDFLWRGLRENRVK